MLLAKYLPHQKPYQPCQMFHTGLYLLTINGKVFFFHPKRIINGSLGNKIIYQYICLFVALMRIPKDWKHLTHKQCKYRQTSHQQTNGGDE